MQAIEIVVRFYNARTYDPATETDVPELTGTVARSLTATNSDDNEENIVRLAEQMVREAFRRLRARTHVVIRTFLAEPDNRTVHVVRPVAQVEPFDSVAFSGSEADCMAKVIRLNNPRAFPNG